MLTLLRAAWNAFAAAKLYTLNRSGVIVAQSIVEYECLVQKQDFL